MDKQESLLEKAKQLESEAPLLAASAPSLTTSASESEIAWERECKARETAMEVKVALEAGRKWDGRGQWRHPCRRMWAVEFGRSAFSPSVTTVGPVGRERKEGNALMAKAIESDKASLGT